MASVTQITQYLYHSDPQKSLVRLTLYHHLKNACDLGMRVDVKMISDFLDHCLVFLYWREKTPQLCREIYQLVHELYEKKLLDSPIQHFEWLKTVQVLELQFETERQACLESYFKKHRPGEKYRITSDGEQNQLVLFLLPSGGLRVIKYSPFFRIQKGELQPLTPVCDLEYTSYMELMPGRQQQLDIDGVRKAHFTLEDDTYIGKIVQGYHFQTAGSIQTREIAGFQEIFYALKSLEKHFIDPKSDPFYNDLVDQLEKAYHLLSCKDPRGYQFAPPILNKGKTALRNIFQKDKLLLLLVTNIEYMLNSGQISKTPTESSPQSWQRVRPLPQ